MSTQADKTTIRGAIIAGVQRQMNRHGYSQAELARRAGIAPRHLSDYLHDRRGLRPEKIDRLLTILGLEVRPAERTTA